MFKSNRGMSFVKRSLSMKDWNSRIEALILKGKNTCFNGFMHFVCFSSAEAGFKLHKICVL